ncbi:MAG: O-antigen ligase C-terminal domain-containing protein [Burkholderiaceae bacterium]|nr:O-antigen ligase C-terminal domain-containing protein [Burkholderiaceae bacterium]
MLLSPSLAPEDNADARPGAASLALAFAAVTLPTLIAYNLPPSATFFNQAAAYVGWGAWVALLASLPGVSLAAQWPGGLRALLAALVLLAAAAAAAPLWAALPWTLALSSIGTIAAAVVVAVAGAALARAGRAQPAFEALCVALLAAGVVGALIGIEQVFAPQWTDGDWIARIGNGRAAGNLRQPNHLSSLLLWSLVALAWLAGRRRVGRAATIGLGGLLLAGVVLSASRTGMLGVLLLGAWGLADRRLPRGVRAGLIGAPVAFALLWLGLAALAHDSHHLFGGDAQLDKGDISSSRFAIWANTLALIAAHPWLGVGWGEFNFVWTLTPFPGRPVAFFDHTHNLPLQFAVELGLPLAALVLALLGIALWRAFKAAGETRDDAEHATLRAAFVMVLLMALHSQLEYPLWYAHFLLPTAFAFGLCLGGTRQTAAAQNAPQGSRTLLLGGALIVLGALAALADYARVVVIFAPPAGAAPLDERIAEGKRSVLFGHHADYAEVTTPGQVIDPVTAFRRAPHYLLDARLMMAWAYALAAWGDTDKASYLAARLAEFHNEQAHAFFAPCDEPPKEGEEPPFQCEPPKRALTYRDFR